MQKDPDYNLKENQGFKLEIGDTVKFGRVRYQVIMMHSQKRGLESYSILDPYQRLTNKIDSQKQKKSRVSDLSSTSQFNQV